MRPAEHVRVNVTNDGIVVLDIAKGQLFTANTIAARIWQSIVVENLPKAQVVDSIVNEYGSTPEIVAKDLDEFVDRLQREELVLA